MTITQQLIEAVWEKATIITGYDSNIWRKDFAGAWINKNAYGTTGPYGWEIDHRMPQAKGGSDALQNLYPCQWENNRTKGDEYPRFKTSVTSDGNHNISREQSWVVR